MLQLRPYQIEITNEIINAINNGSKTILVVSPMGSGKTVIMGNLLSILIIEHKYLYNAVVTPFTNLVNELQVEFDHLNLPTKCMTYQAATTKLTSWPQIDTLILDEVHHEPSPSFINLPNYIKPNIIIGFTATPYRLDGFPLLAKNGGLFETLIEGPSIEKLITDKYLADYEYYSYPLIKHIRRSPIYFMYEIIDYLEQEEYLIDNRSESAVEEYTDKFLGMTGIIFCKSAEHASIMAAKFNAAGINSTSINCYKSKKVTKKAIQDFKDGKITILAACNLVSEGFDHPQAKLGIMARKIAMSQTLFLQQVGRFLRPYNNEKAKILDLAGNCYTFGDIKTVYKRERI
jgi:superfamily II DNA or RNA helicase